MRATGYRWRRTTTWTPTSANGNFCCYVTSTWDFPSSQRQRRELHASTVDSHWIISGTTSFLVLLRIPGTGTTRESARHSTPLLRPQPWT